jgi:hypothetical protein
MANHFSSNMQEGPATTLRILQTMKREAEDKLLLATSSTDKTTLAAQLKTIDSSIKDLKLQRKFAPSVLHEIDELTDRARIMSRLARKKTGWGNCVLYHGTRYLPLVLRIGKLVPSTIGEMGVFFSRSPETAAYFATILGYKEEHLSPGILILDRNSLAQSYRIEPNRYDVFDDRDEREEVVWRRIVSFRRHLLGVVRDADVTSKLGPPKHAYLPEDFLSWSKKRRSNFDKAAWIAGGKLVAQGRANVRRAIIAERRERSSRSTARRRLSRKRNRSRTGSRKA